MDAIRAIIDLLKLKKDAKKADLEIEKLEREKAKTQSLIQPASLADVKKYDPKVEEVERIAREQAEKDKRGRRTAFESAVGLGIVTYLVAYLLNRCTS